MGIVVDMSVVIAIAIIVVVIVVVSCRVEFCRVKCLVSIEYRRESRGLKVERPELIRQIRRQLGLFSSPNR